METVSLEISERQIVSLVKKMSPAGRLAVLRALMPGYDEVEERLAYGEEQMRRLAAERGLNWDLMSDDEREELIDQIADAA